MEWPWVCAGQGAVCEGEGWELGRVEAGPVSRRVDRYARKGTGERSTDWSPYTTGSYSATA